MLTQILNVIESLYLFAMLAFMSCTTQCAFRFFYSILKYTLTCIYTKCVEYMVL